MTATTDALALAAPAHEVPQPVYSGRDMVTALKGYRELQAALDREMPEALITIDGRAFRKKGYWRAVALAFQLDVTFVSETRDVFGGLEGGGENFGYSVVYRASKGDRSAPGDGICTAAEKQRGRMRATEHNVRSHAHTRAYNRAVSNLCGFGEVSAEEIDEAEPPPAKPKGKAATSETPTAKLTDVVTITKLEAPWADQHGNAKAWLSHSGMAPGAAAIPIYQSAVKATAEACYQAKTPVRLEIVTSAASGKPYVKAIVKVDADAPMLTEDEIPFSS